MPNKMKGGNRPFTNRFTGVALFCPGDTQQRPITKRANVVRNEHKQRQRYVPCEHRLLTPNASLFKHPWFRRLSDSEQQRAIHCAQNGLSMSYDLQS